jgi:hypothetical protein
MRHLTGAEIEEYVAGLHDHLALDEVRRHLSDCGPCGDALAREATVELAIRAAARGAAFCVGCDRVVRGSRCRECGAASSAGSYTITDLIVQTPRGRVYLAEDAHGKRVALKELAFVKAPGVDEIEAFDRESRILRTLNHPGIPRFVACFREGTGVETRFYLAQEFIDGDSLERRLRDVQFAEAEIARIARQVLEILVYLQSLSPMVFHRDIKPANLICRPDGTVVLVDFGSARSFGPTANATMVGTFGYMPIEQLGGIVDASSDVYALGASLCQLLTRREPWRLLEDEGLVDRMNVSPGMRRYLARLIARRPEDRYGTAMEALAALEALERNPGGAVRSDRWWPTGARAIALGAALAVSAAAVGVGMALYERSETGSPQDSSPRGPEEQETGPEPRPFLLDEFGEGGRPDRDRARLETGFDLVTDPRGARVFLGGREIGVAPLTVRNLHPGEHWLRVEAAGYAPEEQLVTVVAGRPMRIEMQLAPNVDAEGVRELDSSMEAAQRVVGHTQIQPPLEVQLAMSRDGREQVVARTRLCLTASGDVASLSVVESSGYEGYDQRIAAEMMQWKYRPYMVDGKAVPVCTSVTFKYIQSSGR